MAETYKAMGACDIGYLWVCASEKPEFECLHPSIRRNVGETLMTGHPFVKEKLGGRKTRIPKEKVNDIEMYY